MTEKNIAALIKQQTLDIDALEDEYEFLLTCLVSEYMFKSMAHGHFTGDYETTQYDYIPEKCGKITTEMKKYLDAEIVDSMYTAISAEAFFIYLTDRKGKQSASPRGPIILLVSLYKITLNYVLPYTMTFLVLPFLSLCGKM